MKAALHIRCLWILLILFLCIQLHAIDRDQTLAELYHTAWTFKDGAPAEIYALAQTTDGFLWLGTSTGLYRFDGIRFELYKPQSGKAFPQRSVASLFAVPDGGLWVGYSYGGVSFIKNGKVTDYGRSEGLPAHAVLAFARDRQGAIWIAAGEDGLARLEGSRWRKIGTGWGFSGEADTVFVDHAGTVWVGTPTSVSYLVDGGRRFQIAVRHLKPIVQSFAEAPNGTLWMAEGGFGVRPVPLRGKDYGRSGPAVLVGAPAISFDNQGSLWITTAGDGIRRVPYPERLNPPKIRGPNAWRFHNSDVEAFTEQNGLTSDYVHCVLQDREGNVWFGTTAGLDRFRQSPVVPVPLQPISYRGALPIPSLHSFTTSALAAGEQGSLWAAGVGPQVLLKIRNDKIAKQLRDLPVDCAYRDPNGVVWFATPSAIYRLAHERFGTFKAREITYKYHGAVRVGQGLTLRQLDLPTAGWIAMNPQSRVKAITQDRLGRLWISLPSGTFRLERSGWTSLKTLGGPQGTASAELTDSEGRIWFGLANTVAMLDGNKVTVFSNKDGVHTGTVTSIQGNGARIWIGGEFGLEFFDGSRFRPVVPSDGSAFDGVSGIVGAPEGGLWFSDNRGIIHIPEAQLRQLGSGKVEFESFGLLDGLASALMGPLSSPSAVRTTDGRIWFATIRGVAWINPQRIVRNTVPPPVLIESVIANGRKYNTSNYLRLPPRTTNLQISYTATSLTSPEQVRFRYELQGQDRGWQDAGTRRDAFYTNLGPASYKFRVIACNNDGVWNDTGASLNFSIAPAYYQTLWFRAACIAAFLGLIWTLYRLRVHRVERSYQERKRAEEERERLRQAQRVVVETAHDSVVSSDESGAIQFANSATKRVFGYDPEELIGKPLTVLMPEYMRELHESGFRRYLVTGQRHINWLGTELTGLRKNGQEFPVEISFGELITDGHRVFTGFIRDITERKQAEEERERLRRIQADLAHVTRVSTMGELTASLAHEIKQPIGAAVTNAEACLLFLDRDQPDLPEAREAAVEMSKDARRAADIIERVRSLYRKGPPHQEVVDINGVIREIAMMLQTEADRHSITLRTDFTEGLPMVLADRVQLQQVLMNLMLNGIEAMRETTGGLRIKSQLSEVGQVLISVCDTGGGLPAENTDRIFDAFFTTKPQGTGLGLAITRSIVESHGGRIWATANSVAGATFQFTLPIKENATDDLR